MSDSIVSAISRVLTPEHVGKMASASGLDRGTTQSALSAFVPAILSGFSDLASKPGGARQIADAIADEPLGGPASPAASLTGQTAERGGDILSSLFGGGMLNSLVSTLSRFVGIGEGSTRTLMGLLTPVILGVLGREQRAHGLEASGLARMLIGQKDQIAAAMPGGLSDLLDSRVRLHEGVDTSRAGSRTHDAPHTVRHTTTSGMPRTVTEPREARGTGANWLYWVLPLLVLGGLLWYLLPDAQTPQTGTTTTTAPGQTTPTATPGKLTYLTKPESDWVPVSVYQDQEIYNRAGEKVGTVKDLMVEPDGRIRAAVVGVGRYLGIGEKDVAIPLSALRVERRDDAVRLTADISKEGLQTAPSFEYKRSQGQQ